MNVKYFSTITRVSDWPFALKMGICPALAMLALIGLGLHGVHETGQQARLVRAVVDQDLMWSDRLQASAAQLQEINGQLYRLTTLQAARDPDVAVAREVAALTEQTDHLAKELAAYASASPNANDQQELIDLVREVTLYRDTIDVVGSMLEIDFPSAVELIKPFDAHARKVLASLDAMTHRAGLEADESAEASAALADATRLTVGGVTAIVSLLLFALALLLTRATVRSVRQIADATSLVAKGDQNLDIGALERADELGTIVRSLGAFQANIAQVAFLAHHDPLTSLPNRILFRERVLHALKMLGRGGNFALFFLDLDHFKQVNDTLGHPVGDMLLKQVAGRLEDCVREGDTVSRLGGDEFAILLPGIEQPDAAAQLAQRITEVISQPYEVSGYQVNITTSIGIAFAPADGAYPDRLLKNADMALYQAKLNDRGTACFFKATMDAELQTRRALEIDMRRAIIEGEFELYYQPLVLVRSRTISGFEALIRWRHPTRGIVFPTAFIPIAEDTGLIIQLGQWILRQACLDAMAWPINIKVAVNLSSTQFRDRRLVETVQEALQLTGLPARQLELEITETVLLQETEATLATLHQLRSLGVRIAMDDFGTGYSSMSYLRSFPFDKIKIDQSFVRDLPDDLESTAIVHAVIGLSNSLGIPVTAEGVEREEQVAHLTKEACTEMQGYLFSKPLRAEEIPDLFERQVTWSTNLMAVAAG
jgi:diguanylate cyclase (GGDEF)-like protein